MRAVVQRVRRAAVYIDGADKATIGRGLLVFAAVEKNDAEEDIEYVATKVSNMRIFEDQGGKMNLSVKEERGEILVVSQFTLSGDIRKGRRPSFEGAEKPDLAREKYLRLIARLREEDLVVKEGEFQKHMDVDLVNEGPVTILIDSRKTF